MSVLKAGRPSSEKRTMTMSDISGTDKMKRVNFDLSEALHTRLKTYAASQGKSIKDILTEFVEGLE
ncbi:plasmid partition protein ParG [Aeromonas sp. sif2416]|uniref:plasmid partition protein ParG n=1 Tax=Aeromonas sp. sif2416 TaxID=2854793 RepID=UPI001C464A00|nr:plasmid partition protein ParG [Aeromonas sp. sif2416]MBV7439747.1 chromosome partitioning protein ParB [Aeromonas sp. sif2416]